jgi:hypothetical protein
VRLGLLSLALAPIVLVVATFLPLASAQMSTLAQLSLEGPSSPAVGTPGSSVSIPIEVRYAEAPPEPSSTVSIQFAPPGTSRAPNGTSAILDRSSLSLQGPLVPPVSTVEYIQGTNALTVYIPQGASAGLLVVSVLASAAPHSIYGGALGRTDIGVLVREAPHAAAAEPAPAGGSAPPSDEPAPANGNASAAASASPSLHAETLGFSVAQNGSLWGAALLGGAIGGLGIAGFVRGRR